MLFAIIASVGAAVLTTALKYQYYRREAQKAERKEAQEQLHASTARA